MNFIVKKAIVKASSLGIKAVFGDEFQIPKNVDECVTCLKTIRDKVLEGRSIDPSTPEGKIYAEVTDSIEKIKNSLKRDVGMSDVIGIGSSIKNIVEELKKIRSL